MNPRIYFLSILLWGTSVFAEQKMTWQESVYAASKASADLQAAKSFLEAARYQESGSYSTFLPQVSGSLTYNHNSSSNPSGLGGGGNQSGTTYVASVNANENLFSGFQDRARISQAKANREALEAKLAQTKARVSFDLKSGFAGSLFAEGSTRIRQEILRRRQSNLKLVELRFHGGRENQGSVLLSRAYLEQAKYDVQQSLRDGDVSSLQLSRLLGLETRVTAAGEIPVSTPPQAPPLKNLVLTTPDYLMAVSDEKAAEASLELARSGFFPVLSLNGGTTYTGQRFFPDNQRWTIGASLTIPLFNGGRDLYGTLSASESLKASAFAKENALRGGLTRLEQVLSDFELAVQKVKVDHAFLEAAHLRAKIAKEKYNNGLLSFEEWDIIENDLIVREKNVLQSERDRIVAEAQWEQVQGKGVIP